MPLSSFHPDFPPKAPGDLFLVTGSRNYPLLQEVEAWARDLPAAAYLMHGGARGVDMAAHHGFYTRHPLQQILRRNANWRPNGVFDWSAGFRRNGEMIAECGLLQQEGWKIHVHAFWDGISNGTKDTCEKALLAGFAVILHLPDQPPETWSC